MREKKKVYKILVGNPEQKRPPGGLRHRQEDGIKMDLRQTGSEGAECIHVAQDMDWR
jgi:hypothetical protein